MAAPALVAQPLRLEPFAALMLAPNRVGGQAAARAFGRPHGDVAERFAAWQRTGEVIQDREPALYLHEYTTSGVSVRGLVGGLELTHQATTRDDIAVYPHEGVHLAQAAELADRMAEMAMNPAPILLTHRAPAQLRELLRDVQTAPTDRQFTDRSGQYHRIWAIRDPAVLAAVGAGLRDTRALIADGHHRYAAYGMLRTARPDLAPGTNAGLAMLVDQDDTPLFLGAIHRVLFGIRIADLDGLAFRTRRGLGPQEAVSALSQDTVVATDGQQWATIALPHDDARLTAEVLQEDLLPALERAPSAVGHAHSVDDALRTVARRRGLAILMPAPDFADVLRVVRLGRLLPEKVTSFQPKPSAGVLIRSLRAG